MPRAGIKHRHGERGVTMLLVVVGMFAILAMAALAMDLVILYLAKSEAQKAADAAALAGAKMFVVSGITSGSGLSNICGGAPTDASNMLAGAVAQQQPVGGVNAQITNMTCNLANLEDPQLTVTVARTDLPTFFGRIFGSRFARVSATATAEAYNNSGGTAQLQLGSVKPWLISNCDPAQTPPNGCPYFVNSANNYVLNNPAAYMGRQFSFQMRNQVNPPANSQYYIIDLPAANICPATSAPGCGNVGGGGGTVGYLDTIACANTNRLQCGDTVNLDKLNGSPPNIADTISGTQCLVHATTIGPGGNEQDSFSVGAAPIVITGGLQNPNPAFRNTVNISHSDSVVTVPLFDWTGDPCPANKCGTEVVMGFLQLGIQDVTVAGNIDAVVLNAVGCNPGFTTGPISGGGVSAVPVRLVAR